MEYRLTYPKDGTEYMITFKAATVLIRTGRISPHKRADTHMLNQPLRRFLGKGVASIEKSPWQLQREADAKQRRIKNPPGRGSRTH